MPQVCRRAFSAGGRRRPWAARRHTAPGTADAFTVIYGVDVQACEVVIMQGRPETTISWKGPTWDSRATGRPISNSRLSWLTARRGDERRRGRALPDDRRRHPRPVHRRSRNRSRSGRCCEPYVLEKHYLASLSHAAIIKAFASNCCLLLNYLCYEGRCFQTNCIFTEKEKKMPVSRSPWLGSLNKIMLWKDWKIHKVIV